MTNDEIMALQGDALDEAVAITQNFKKYKVDQDNAIIWLSDTKWIGNYHPSTNGSQLIEIMEREHISVNWNEIGWMAQKEITDYVTCEDYISYGETINEAVLRCFLLSKQPPSQD